MTAGDSKRQGTRAREYILEVKVQVWRLPSGKWRVADHLGRGHTFPTEALANDYAQGVIEAWVLLIDDNP